MHKRLHSSLSNGAFHLDGWFGFRFQTHVQRINLLNGSSLFSTRTSSVRCKCYSGKLKISVAFALCLMLGSRESQHSFEMDLFFVNELTKCIFAEL